MLVGIIVQRKVKSVKTFRNEKGFTLIESLLSLVIFMIIISITTSSLSVFVKRNHNKGSLNLLEWDNFINEVQEEANISSSQTVYSELLIFEDSFEVTSSYQKYADIVRRQVLGAGHEIVLQNISKITFEKNGKKQITIKVVDLNGNIFEKNIRLFIN